MELKNDYERKPTLLWVLGNSIVFLALSVAIQVLSLQLPATDTKSEWFRRFTYRGDDVYNTTHIQWSTLAYYWVMSALGHCYVNVSNLNFQRKSFINTRSTKYFDFCLLLAVSPLLWFFSTQIILRAPMDIYATSGEVYDDLSVVNYNQVNWALTFLAGLNFTYLDGKLLENFRFTYEKMKDWSLSLWLFTALIAVFLLQYEYCLVMAYYACGKLLFYLGLQIVIIVCFVVKTILLRKTHTIHIHHYTWGMFVVVSIGYQAPWACLLSGFANGMMVEGGSRWGYDPIWHRKYSRFENDLTEVKNKSPESGQDGPKEIEF